MSHQKVYWSLICFYLYYNHYSWVSNPRILKIDFLKIDFSKIDDCDLFVACPTVGGVHSSGVHLELGYAIAKKKSIIVLIQNAQEQSFMVKGFVDSQPSDVKAIYCNGKDDLRVYMDRVLEAAESLI